jgi:predicted O-methyltransferase YrrM
LYGLCKANQYNRLLDLGSGFSSYALRLYAKETSGVEVLSVDDDVRWLEKTKDFLAAHSLDTTGLMTLEQFASRDQGGFDCILHDLNFVEERIKYVQRLLPMVRPRGLILLDDVHKPDYMLGALEILSLAPGKVYSLSPATLDRYGRYSMAYVRPA